MIDPVKETTPMMKQWDECKKQAQDSLLLFRLGDFYEAFYEDAQLLSETLSIVLTKRGTIPMAGIPAVSLETSLEKLIDKGLRVAIAEQMEPSFEGKGIVKRKVTRVETPSTFTSKRDQNSGSNRFLLSLCFLNQSYSIAYTDTSTAEFFFSTFLDVNKMKEELLRVMPKELLVSSKLISSPPSFLDDIKESFNGKMIPIDPFYFDHKMCVEKLHRHLNVSSLDGFGLKGDLSAINACGALLTYLENHIFFDTSVITTFKKQETATCLSLDPTTLAHLEVFHSPSGSSLFKTINFTHTSLGERYLKRALFYPLIDREKILFRQKCVATFLEKSIDLSAELSPIKDIERLMTTIARKKGSPLDLILLANSLVQLPKIIKKLPSSLSALTDGYSDFPLASTILNTLSLDHTDYFIAKGVNPTLDRIKLVETNASLLIKSYEEQSKQTLGIKTLKIGHSRSFGYFIEVSSKSAHLVPPSYQRKQTLVNTERFVTSELVQLEQEILSAKDQALFLEQEELNKLFTLCLFYKKEILFSAQCIAYIDFLHSLKTIALSKGYICPCITDENAFHIINGSHPILLKTMKRGAFIPNNIDFNKDRQMLILTGPNMAGKSTYIKSVALLSILAQIGSFIPAQEATMGIVDKIFTRIGALDDLQRGQSTFMVEMTETANILRNATSKSLIILDEIGRGTSTVDGIALAKSIAHYIVKEIGAKTLFATHYLELTSLAQESIDVKNIRSAVSEKGGVVTFLHTIEEGQADQSYGIFVGELAGLPRGVILEAKEHLKKSSIPKELVKKKEPLIHQYTLFTEEAKDPIIGELEGINPDHLTPFEALQTLVRWKKSLL
jgi:DNA mismatch repair protein MutS